MMWNGGTRTCEKPYGDGTLDREILGNKQLAAAWRLMCVFLELGIPFTIENPAESMVWNSNEMKELARHPQYEAALIDQCMHHLRPVDWNGATDVRIRKRTRVAGTVAGLASLRCLCDRKHEHSWAVGRCRVNNKRVSRARAAGAYPLSLCQSLARLVCAQCQ